MMKPLVVIILVFNSLVTLSQDKDTVAFINPYPNSGKYLHRLEGPRFAQSESSIGIVPSVEGFKDLYLGIGISKARFLVGEGGGNSFGTEIGFDYNPIEKISAPYAHIWANAWFAFLGFTAGATVQRYNNGDALCWAIRPELGWGIFKGFLNYGYNFYLQDTFPGINKHSLTFKIYLTALPPRRN